MEEQKEFYRGKCKYAWYIFKNKSDSNNHILCWADPDIQKIKEAYFVCFKAKNNGILDVDALPDVVEHDKLEAKLFQLGISDWIVKEIERCGSTTQKRMKGLGIITGDMTPPGN